MLRAARGGMWVKNFQNGFNSRMTHHIQSVMASSDIASYQLLNSLGSTSFDASQATDVTNKTTGEFYIVCGVSECGGADKCS
jgi:hypothetical protein